MDKSEIVLPYVISDLEKRVIVGTKKYGQPLMTHTDRKISALQDAYEEALDLAMYLKKALLEQI